MQKNLLILLSAATLGMSQTSAQTLTTLHSFTGADGFRPQADLISDAAGNLYSTTLAGGANDQGTVFKVAPSGIHTVLYSFTGGSDGSRPWHGLVADPAGNLYGTASGNFPGTVFKVTPSGAYTVLYSFTDGARPIANVITDAAGNLYGTTFDGGANDPGTVFKVTPSGVYSLIHSFAGSDGRRPYSSLIADAAGNLYGTTVYGGTNDAGTVFKVTPSGVHTVLYSFTGGNDGLQPWAGLIVDESGNLYGTTLFGGANNRGTIFKVTPSGTKTMLYSFAGNEGSTPYGRLMADASGNLYGTTFEGGANGAGTVFKLTPSGIHTLLYSFTGGNDGSRPQAGLIADAAGDLYGTTSRGGTSNAGTVFKLTLPKEQVTISSSPVGRTFSVFGTGCEPGTYTAPQTSSWVPGSSCIVNFTPTQNGTAGTQYVFKDWSDGDTAISRTITAPAGTATYTANFKTQYELTSSVSPIGSGSVTGAGYYDAGSVATVIATANAGNQFLNWTGPVASPSSASTTVTMSAPVAVTANFLLGNIITFNAISGQEVGASVNLSTYASASSGLPVSFASLTTGICTVSGTTASMISSGICTIQASQAGNGTYAPATPVSSSIKVTGSRRSTQLHHQSESTKPNRVSRCPRSIPA